MNRFGNDGCWWRRWMSTHLGCIAALMMVLGVACPCFAQSTRLLPDRVELTHADSSQQLLVQQVSGDGKLMGQVEGPVTWRSLNESVCRVRNGLVEAVGDGQTEVVAGSTQPGGQEVESRVSVIVRRADASPVPEFGNQIEAIFSRHGCNMGACHGALAGKGGFRLSLRGYDPAADYHQITRADHGRRIDWAEPSLSLLLAKASGAVPHQGGLRLPPDSRDYQRLAQWIAAGAPPSAREEPKVEALEVWPPSFEGLPSTEQSLVVRARYSDGRMEDVTHWAKFSATDEAVAKVDPHGRVAIVGPGVGSVVVWFASRIVLAEVMVPYANKPPESLLAEFPITNPIDQAVMEQWRALNLAPSPRCSDEQFLRRAYLDTIGRIPEPQEVVAFLEDPGADKRSKLIEQLLERPEFVDYWSYLWSDLLMLNGNLLRPEPIQAYYGWIRKHVAANTPWDSMVREILTAQGESVTQGATNFYALHQDPESMTENACQAFLGLSIGCAKCHNHPLEKWTNDQYYGMANLFARVRAKGWGGDGRDGDGKRTVVVLEQGDVIQPSKGKPQPPAPLDAPPIDPDSPADRRVALADWMVSQENPYFTKAIVNRVWANFFGIGIIQPVDDLRASNPPSNPKLIAALEQHLIDHRYDLKSLMRLILESETYQRASEATVYNEQDRKQFTRYYPRRLMAEVLLDAICQVTGVPQEFKEIEFSGADRKPTDAYPKGTRAIQLHDSAVRSTFLKTFGRHQRRITCDCERSNEPSVIQVLHLNNGETLNEKLGQTGSVVDLALAELAGNPEGMVRKAFLQTLSRQPTEAELRELVSELTQVPQEEQRQAVEDFYWSLMSSREFLYHR